ncbi:MAG: sugar phosphate isomerase/epimerase [Gemmatimonadaceae bacterium]
MISRREFLVGLGAAAAGSAMPIGRVADAMSRAAGPTFKVSVLTDEISQDLGHACEIAAREFRLGYVELRAMNNKNVMRWDTHDIHEARRILGRYRLRVSEIASPIFKVDWPGAPTSSFSPKHDQFGADFTYEQQDELLERGIALARAFNTRYVRIFDFWRLDDQDPYREAIDDRIRQAAIKVGKKGITLTLENEFACNTATGTEVGRLLRAVRVPSLMVNWDPGNAAARGETPFPDGYAAIPKERIGHVHCKDVVRLPDGKTDWAAMGRGVVDWIGQYRALKKDGYRGAISLETHWRGAGTPEESTRQSMAGLKELLKKADV